MSSEETSVGAPARGGASVASRALAPIETSGLVAFRVMFGLLGAFSALRFEWNGWVERSFGAPSFFFHYFGFEWLEPLSLSGMHTLFAVMTIASLGIALGALYRVSAIAYALTFTYVELVDVTNYLNHYYLVSLLACLVAVLPLHRVASVDAWVLRRVFGRVPLTSFPAYFSWLLRGQVAAVYFYAAIAKATSDWLFHAQPMSIWLGARTDLPLAGAYFDRFEVALFMSWAGFLYDLTIPIWLSFRRTRPWAYLAVIVFHASTRALFDIGLFPVIMLVATTVFFDHAWPRAIARRLRGGASLVTVPLDTTWRESRVAKAGLGLAAIWLALQWIVPLRAFGYGGNVLWHEQGMRFSWRVMCREKNGSVLFRVRAPGDDHERFVAPDRYLTSVQEREMAAQPDLILQLAHRIADDESLRRGARVEVRVDAYASLNGRRQRLLIDPDVDLASVEASWAPAVWIMPSPTEPPPRFESRRYAERLP